MTVNVSGIDVVMLDSKREDLLDQYVKYLKMAHSLLRQKGLSEAWYGRVYIDSKDHAGMNENGSHYGVGAQYDTSKNIVTIFSDPSPNIIMGVLHELGHRYWFKSMTSEQRARFESLVRVKKPTDDSKEALEFHNAFKSFHTTCTEMLEAFRTLDEVSVEEDPEGIGNLWEMLEVDCGFMLMSLRDMKTILTSYDRAVSMDFNHVLTLASRCQKSIKAQEDPMYIMGLLQQLHQYVESFNSTFVDKRTVKPVSTYGA